MKWILFFLTVLMININIYSQDLDRSVDTAGFGSIIVLLNNSTLNSGTITFRKEGNTTFYKYIDTMTTIEVKSIPGRYGGERINFDTISPDFLIFNIKVGTLINDVIRELGPPLERSAKFLSYTTVGYFLIFYIRNNQVERIIYNPYEWMYK